MSSNIKYTKEKAAEALKQAWSCYDNSRAYLQQKNLINAVDEWLRFYEGDHWNQIKLDIPKITINVIKMIIDNKIGNLLAAPITLNYEASEDGIKTKQFSRFAKYICKEINMETILREVATAAYTKGTGIVHVFWDNDAIGKPANFDGGLRIETLDFRNVGLADPTVKDIQKQKWITIAKRVDIKSILQTIDKKNRTIDVSKITADDNDNLVTEQEDSKLVTVLTRYFRIDGEVYFEKSVKETIISPPKPLNPFLNLYNKYKKEIEKRNVSQDDGEVYDIDIPTADLVDYVTQYDSLRKNRNTRRKFHLYPIETLVFSEIDNCAYGVSEIKEMIPTQKSINLFYSALVKNGYDMGFPRYIAKKNAIKGKITGKNNEMIIDETPYGSDWGLKILQGSPPANATYMLPDKLIEALRSVKNSTEVMTGEMINNLSGVAITALQGQAEKTIGLDKQRFLTFYEKIGKILELFYKFHYQETEFNYELSNGEIEELKANNIEPFRYQKDTFNGRDYIDTTFNIIVQAGTGIKYSEMYAIDFANNLVLNGNIEKLSAESLELLLLIYPNEAMPYKEEIKDWIRNKNESEKAMLQQQLAQQQQQNQVLAQTLNQVQAQTKYLQTEFKEKIEAQNKVIESMSNFLKNTAYTE